MILAKIPENILVFGNQNFRGDCPSESSDQVSFFSWLELNYSDFYRAAIHPKNEGKRTGRQAAKDAALGSLNAGASDIIIPAGWPFVCEMKRKDHTKSAISDDQIGYLVACANLGSFCCVAMGLDGAKQAFKCYLKQLEKKYYGQ